MPGTDGTDDMKPAEAGVGMKLTYDVVPILQGHQPLVRRRPVRVTKPILRSEA